MLLLCLALSAVSVEKFCIWKENGMNKGLIWDGVNRVVGREILANLLTLSNSIFKIITICKILFVYF